MAFVALTAVLLLSCGGVKVPEKYTQSDTLPAIYPDYTNVTVPVNIAPLTFQMDRAADEMVARFSVGDTEVLCGPDKAQPDADDWRELVEKARGKAIQVEVYARNGEQWTRFQPFNIYVSPDSIDPYISYRIIPPSFVSYEDLTIRPTTPSVCRSMPARTTVVPSLLPMATYVRLT